MTAPNGPEDRPLVAWDVPVPETRKKKIPIWRPKPGQPVVVIILSESILSVEKHYMPRRTIPCTGNKETCEGCQAKLPRRWYGYFACCGAMDRLLCIAEVTIGAVDSCPTLKNRKVNLRGSRLTLKRSGNAANSPVVAELLPGRHGLELPAEFDLKEQLLLIWDKPTYRSAKLPRDLAEEDFRRQMRHDEASE